MNCGRVRDLFGAYWDDEITQAEREWMDAHFASCTPCREQYDEYARTLELVASLPREEAAAGFVERVMTRARRASETPDRLPSRNPRWVPVAAAAALGVLVFAAVVPWLRPGFEVARTPARSAPAGQVSGAIAPGTEAGPPEPSLRASAAGGRGAVAVVGDSVFDHAEDVEFILDPVTAHRGRTRAAAPPATAVQGERAVITF